MAQLNCSISVTYYLAMDIKFVCHYEKESEKCEAGMGRTSVRTLLFSITFREQISCKPNHEYLHQNSSCVSCKGKDLILLQKDDPVSGFFKFQSCLQSQEKYIKIILLSIYISCNTTLSHSRRHVHFVNTCASAFTGTVLIGVLKRAGKATEV